MSDEASWTTTNTTGRGNRLRTRPRRRHRRRPPTMGRGPADLLERGRRTCLRRGQPAPPPRIVVLSSAATRRMLAAALGDRRGTVSDLPPTNRGSLPRRRRGRPSGGHCGASSRSRGRAEPVRRYSPPPSALNRTAIGPQRLLVDGDPSAADSTWCSARRSTQCLRWPDLASRAAGCPRPRCARPAGRTHGDHRLALVSCDRDGPGRNPTPWPRDRGRPREPATLWSATYLSTAATSPTPHWTDRPGRNWSSRRKSGPARGTPSADVVANAASTVRPGPRPRHGAVSRREDRTTPAYHCSLRYVRSRPWPARWNAAASAPHPRPTRGAAKAVLNALPPPCRRRTDREPGHEFRTDGTSPQRLAVRGAHPHRTVADAVRSESAAWSGHTDLLAPPLPRRRVAGAGASNHCYATPTPTDVLVTGPTESGWTADQAYAAPKSASQ